MFAVINAIKLLLLISFGLAYLLGLGWILIGLMLHGSLISRYRNIPLMQELPLMLISGTLINYGILLIFQSVTVSLTIGLFISLFGLSCFGLYVFRFYRKENLSKGGLIKLLGIAFAFLLLLGPTLFEPLKDWDARSTWFFHAKMIYIANSIGQSAGWQYPSIGFSHPDYPNLIPSLAAEITKVMGFWNEYLPKASFLFLLAPAVTLLFSFARRSLSFAILLFTIPFSFSVWMWNGYMDGYIALYFSLAMLFLGKYINSSQPIDIISSLWCLITLLYIKNEGALAAIIGGCLAISTVFLLNRSASPKKIFSENWRYCVAILILLLPFILWNLYKHQWGLKNNLEIGTTQSYLRIINRLTEGSYQFIAQEMFKQIKNSLLLLILLYSALVVLKKTLPKESLPPLIAGGIYSLGIVVIYLLVPSDLTWYINESVNRLMLAVNGCIFIGIYYILYAIENNEKSTNSLLSSAQK